MRRILKYYIILVFAFESLTLLFLLVYHSQYEAYTTMQILQTLGHSIGNHMIVSAYVLLPIAFANLINVHLKGNWYRCFMMLYLGLAGTVITTLCCIDLVLYGYWGFRLNLTPFVYVFDNPISTMKESPVWAIWGTFVMLLILVLAISTRVGRANPKGSHFFKLTRTDMPTLVVGTLSHNVSLLLLLVLSWGGTPAHNLGMRCAYFSDEVLLNHAATNPVYSFFYALRHQQKPLNRQYHFFDNAQEVWEDHMDDSSCCRQLATTTELLPHSLADSSLLTTPRPDILLVIFESFSGSVCHYLYREADRNIMPNVNDEMRRGIAFTQLYANSFRTERGLVSILSSYPAQPTYSVMTDTMRCKHLDYLTAQLHHAGYTTQLMHGGDDNFCQLKHYLRCGEVEENIGRYHFEPSEYDYARGLHDEKMARFVYQQVHEANAHGERFVKIYTTMSSHEPFKVPFHRYDEPYLNSVAYADSCFGLLMDDLRADTAVWRNLLVIGLSDHCCASWPRNVQQHHPLRYHIPMFWTGGAVRDGHRDIDVVCQQTDLTATLLNQMNLLADSSCGTIDANDFIFSHDILNPHLPHFAFYTWPDGFGFLTDSICYIQDNNNDGHALAGSFDPTGKAQCLGKAYLQNLYDDLSEK